MVGSVSRSELKGIDPTCSASFEPIKAYWGEKVVAYYHLGKVSNDLSNRTLMELLSRGGLRSPYFSHIVGIVQDENELGYMTEWAEGLNLTHHLVRIALKPDDKIQIAFQICVALNEAHSQGVTGFDLTSANIVCVYGKYTKIWSAKLCGLVSPKLQLELFPDNSLRSYLFKIMCTAPSPDIYAFGSLLIELFAQSKQTAHFVPWRKMPIGEQKLPSEAPEIKYISLISSGRWR